MKGHQVIFVPGCQSLYSAANSSFYQKRTHFQRVQGLLNIYQPSCRSLLVNEALPYYSPFGELKVDAASES
uniref:Uncharacterized protein n=1 Tax=Rhizophora mucronata TaxID=61149 RepID=A0A2P2JPL8_RHIMU